MSGTRLFPLPGRNEPRTIVPRFLARGADIAPPHWDQTAGLSHASKRLATVVPTLSLAAWLKSVDVVHSDTVNVRGAVLQDQIGTSSHPALHVGWGTPWLGGLTLWDRAYLGLPNVGRPGRRVAMEAAKWSARTEIGPWGANYGDSLIENAGLHRGSMRRSSVRISLAEAIRFVLRTQKTGSSVDPELIRHGVELVQAGISQATEVAGETIEAKNVQSFYQFVTETGIAPRGIDIATGRETDLVDLVEPAEREWAPANFIKKAQHYNYSDEAVERERELWLPPEFREQAKVTVETMAETNKRPPANMSTESVKSMEQTFEKLAPEE